MLIAYDWGEAFVALNLAVKPVVDEVFNMQLAELARAHEDDLLALMLDDFALDSQRSRDWSEALVKYAVAQRPANQGLLKQWVEQWKPLAYRGLEGVVELFGHAPRPPVRATPVSATLSLAPEGGGRIANSRRGGQRCQRAHAVARGRGRLAKRTASRC